MHGCNCRKNPSRITIAIFSARMTKETDHLAFDTVAPLRQMSWPTLLCRGQGMKHCAKKRVCKHGCFSCVEVMSTETTTASRQKKMLTAVLHRTTEAKTGICLHLHPSQLYTLECQVYEIPLLDVHEAHLRASGTASRSCAWSLACNASGRSCKT